MPNMQIVKNIVERIGEYKIHIRRYTTQTSVTKHRLEYFHDFDVEISDEVHLNTHLLSEIKRQSFGLKLQSNQIF